MVTSVSHVRPRRGGAGWAVNLEVVILGQTMADRTPLPASGPTTAGGGTGRPAPPGAAAPAANPGWITVANFPARLEAYLSFVALESEGVTCFLPNGYRPAPAQGVALQVRPADVTRAGMILNAVRDEVAIAAAEARQSMGKGAGPRR